MAWSVPECAKIALAQDCLDDAAQTAYRAATPTLRHRSALNAIEWRHPTPSRPRSQMWPPQCSRRRDAASPFSRSWAQICPRIRAISFRTPHSALRSPGTSPNFRITVASRKWPIAGSPVRLKAIAPTWPGLRTLPQAFITAALGLKHSMASAGAIPFGGSDEGKGNVIGHFRHILSPFLG